MKSRADELRSIAVAALGEPLAEASLNGGLAMKYPGGVLAVNARELATNDARTLFQARRASMASCAAGWKGFDWPTA